MRPLTGSFRPPFFPFTAASFHPSLSVCLSLVPPAKARTPLLLESLDISDSKHNFSPRWTIRVPRDSSVVTESSCLIEISYSLTYYLRKPYLRHAWPVQPRRQTSWKLPTGRVDPLHISPPPLPVFRKLFSFPNFGKPFKGKTSVTAVFTRVYSGVFRSIDSIKLD